MRYVIKLYHFLGGIYFTIGLIGAVALFVIMGTVLESRTQSHLYAARLTYGNPIFAMLLWGFFINILFSATRRWPFQVRHIPFLTTHFGLLMVLGGALIKAYVGQQGAMSLIEGAGSDRIYEANTYAVLLEKKGETSPKLFEVLPSHWNGESRKVVEDLDGLELTLLRHVPHSAQKLRTWVKGDFATIDGLDPIPVVESEEIAEEYKPQGQVRFRGSEARPWDVYAIRTTHVKALAQKLNRQNMHSDKPPGLAIIEDREGAVHMFAFGPYGQVWNQAFQCDNLQTLYAYDDGFSGYAVVAEVPCPTAPNKRLLIDQLLLQLNQATEKHALLSPPLALFQKTCTAHGLDFAETFVAFLDHWDDVGGWLYPGEATLPAEIVPVFQHLEMSREEEGRACEWAVRLFDRMAPELDGGSHVLEVLQKRKWPLMGSLEEALAKEEPGDADKTTRIMTLLTRQIFSAGAMLPAVENEGEVLEDHAKRNARLYSAYLRAYEIHLKTILPVPIADTLKEHSPIETISLETSVIATGQPLPPESKLEDNIPLITLQAKRGAVKEVISLGYDRSASGLKWPVLNGQYLLRFQPKYTHIPYRVRLRQARQINYANSGQAYSYESDLIITDKRTGRSVETTISMNHVYETNDGYRFYMANITPSNETSVKRVQIVVNHDPGKYWLTYPGAIIMCCGIVLLFSMRPYKQR